MREITPGLKEKLRQGLQDLHLSLDALQIQQLECYLLLMQKWNAVYNLTAITDLDAMLSHHLLDSLAIAPYITAQNYLDVGTGAGLPGIPLAICFPDKKFTLLDSNSKKTGFLLEVVRQCQLKNVQVVHARIESAPLGLFDGVVSRAFSALNDFIAVAASQLKPGGVLLAMKGPKLQHELAHFVGEYKVHEITVPFLNEQRFLCIIKVE
jgi:16S rRNA (guanine527-N7)-methyltransferase